MNALIRIKNAAGKRPPPDPESAFTTQSMRTCFGVCQNNSLEIRIADPSGTQQFALHPPRTTGIHLVICIHTDIQRSGTNRCGPEGRAIYTVNSLD